MSSSVPRRQASAAVRGAVHAMAMAHVMEMGRVTMTVPAVERAVRIGNVAMIAARRDAVPRDRMVRGASRAKKSEFSANFARKSVLRGTGRAGLLTST